MTHKEHLLNSDINPSRFVDFTIVFADTVMNIYVLILTTVTVFVGTKSKDLVFQPRLFHTDVTGILLGYQHLNPKHMIAYIHLPESITFRVRSTGAALLEDRFLVFDGKFQLLNNIKKHFYDGLYFSVTKHEFYVKKSSTGPMELIKLSKRLRYVQPVMEETKPYFSIRYFGVKELTQEISSFFSGYESYYKSHIYGFPATFLVASPYGDGFLEYCFRGSEREKKKVMKILIAEENEHSVTILEDRHFDDLVFDGRNGELLLPVGKIKKGKVFGIRASMEPFLSEVLESGVTMFGIGDFLGSLRRAVRDRQLQYEERDNLLTSLQHVGLRYPHYNIPSSCPKSVKFQVYGMIFVKSVNYLVTGEEVDEECPFVVEFEDGKGSFAYKSYKVPKLCTNDTHVWAYKEPLITL